MTPTPTDNQPDPLAAWAARVAAGGAATPFEVALERVGTALLVQAGILTPIDPEYEARVAGLIVEHCGVDQASAVKVAGWVAPQFFGLTALLTLARGARP